jgi:hypothetical protein
MGPFEDEQWPLGKVKVTRGAVSAHGPLDAMTWVKIAEFIKEQKPQKGGEDHGGRITSGDVEAGDHWGR